MSHRVLSIVGGLGVAACLFLPAGVVLHPAWAQSVSSAPAQQSQAPAGKEAGKEPQKVDEYAEAQRAINGPAGNPECVWLGRRVVSLLWRDDLDTAFRHLDLYDRFGCPSGHVQAAFRCLVLHSNSVDPKIPDSLNGQVLACWINPSREAAAASPAASPAPAAAAPSPTTTR
ncbi:MAG: beta-1-3, beta-1-6-glucan biosynthesis protein [Xanthobacteraceae bacterium]